MMNPACEEIRLELPMYVRSGLDPSRTRPVEEHLGSCGACRDELFELQRLEAVLDAHLPTMTPSPAFASTFANRLAAEVLAEEEAASRGGLLSGWIRPWLVPLAVGAALAIAVVQQASVQDPAGTPVASLPEPAPAPVADPVPAGVEPVREVASVEPAATGPGSGQPPEEVLDRLDLFVDYAVIEHLEWLEASGHAG